MTLTITSELKTRFPGLKVLVCRIKDVTVSRGSVELEGFKEQLFRQVKEKYSLESLKDVPIFRAYRDFFWKAGIDPTKVRPAAEALIRRILGGKAVPSINNVVDSYNLASIKTEVALAAFDEDKLKGDLIMRYAGKVRSF